MNKTEFFVTVADYVDAIMQANEARQKNTRDEKAEILSQNLFHLLKAETKKYAQAAREKLEKMKENQKAMEHLKNELGVEPCDEN